MSHSPDLFALAAPEHRVHPQFRSLRDSLFHGDARALMNELYQRMGDPNGNFLEDFQMDGFHSRVFELGCFAYLESAGFAFDRTHAAPDFLCTRNGATIAVEVTTANPTNGQSNDISGFQMQELSASELEEKVAKEFPKRMLRILRRKVAHGYNELPQCKGTPLILMAAPLFEPGSVFYPDEALADSLYGLNGFFHQPNTKAISAVLYCNGFTVPRFFRLATRLDRNRMSAVREGMCCIEQSEETYALCDYGYEIGTPSAPQETWSQGVTLFLNPYAINPAPQGCLPNTCTYSTQGNCLIRDIHGFHPLTSVMTVTVAGG